MFVTMNRIPVRPEYAEQFEEAFRQRARLVDRMPGFIVRSEERRVGKECRL